MARPHHFNYTVESEKNKEYKSKLALASWSDFNLNVIEQIILTEAHSLIQNASNIQEALN